MYKLIIFSILLVILTILSIYIYPKLVNIFTVESFQNISEYYPDWDTQAIGFGSNASGCGPDPNRIWEIKKPSDFEQLKKNIQDNQLIFIDGEIDLVGTENTDDAMKLTLKNKKNISIIGRNNAVLKGSISIGEESQNIQIRNIYFDGLFEDGDTESDIDNKKPGDFISIKGGDKGIPKDIWIDHCTFTKTADGLLDMTNGATNITVSWCIFGDPTKSRDRNNADKANTTHHKVMLIGADDHDNVDEEERDRNVKITIHHCWFPGNSRNPRIRYAQPIHLYNNFYDQNSYYSIGARQKTISLSENNYFYRSARPYDTEDNGKLYIIGDILKDTCVDDPPTLYMSDHISAKLSKCAANIIEGGGGDEGNYMFEKDTEINKLITYNYEIDDANIIPENITSKAGAYRANSLNNNNGFPPFKFDVTESTEDTENTENTENTTVENEDSLTTDNTTVENEDSLTTDNTTVENEDSLTTDNTTEEGDLLTSDNTTEDTNNTTVENESSLTTDNTTEEGDLLTSYNTTEEGDLLTSNDTISNNNTENTDPDYIGDLLNIVGEGNNISDMLNNVKKTDPNLINNLVNNVRNIKGTDISNILHKLPEFDETMINNLVDTARNGAAEFLGQPQFKVNPNKINTTNAGCDKSCQKRRNLQHVQKLSLDTSLNDFSIPETTF